MSLRKKLWAMITRSGDGGGQYPIQQATYLGRVTDFFTLFPYGMHADLPKDQLGLVIDEQGRIFMASSAIGRIAVEEGEVVFYHPDTKSKLHFKARGDIDLDAGSANVNIDAGDVNVNATNVNVEGLTTLGTGGLPIARVGDAVLVAGVPGTITSGGLNTSL